ncbi:TPA: sigma-70 family RNA polymerase sigma factor [Salmonella enterica subsp. enterica serovar Paratyphi B]|uniref:Sigma-70 family RNA polymerase sigma factor n=2 Tax=Salmonella paratyphi B TaxID=57045 RepID=A0A8E6KGE3_SALEB|nr:sigma-70 family RNA polymerase sigma factor [Salmonella enterica subsp. enterica]QVQ04510.1 sigma-70 family RNA polymerase sigma factor [Salmonella enterica subsp. enterica serovar Paratyphi B str. CFSAN000541]HAE2678935.1 sigma-70 family RNA polymerase sigma factor [Salmonella enterica subsp. enterica serovar Paratyphi B]EDP8565065.1 sigma-70 family RNA polymerase sigma factor [Salmonella enterica subsp. enterica]EDS6679492.1 sigma-70 family RNA polymerase sigma factor [Salmonella enterica 
MSDIPAFNRCMSVFWRQHEGEFSRFLISKTGDSEKAADLLQDLFLRARAHSDIFCEMENPRAWLYRVARNLLIDEYRTTREFVELEENALLTDASPDAISTLDICLPETLQALPEDERLLIEESDLNRRPQQSLADEWGITLTAFKSRLLRARKHLKETMTELCQIQVDDTSHVCCHKKMN